VKGSSDVFKGLSIIKGDERVVVLDTIEVRTVLHETGHSVGLYHEHQRPDRDTHIKINYDELFKKDFSVIYSFMYLKPTLYDYRDYEYDYTSVMHYNSDDVSNVFDYPVLLSGSVVSDTDAQKVKDIYADEPRVFTYSLFGFSMR
jgi:hypothetical protein